MQDATRVVRGTLRTAAAGEPLHSGPVFASPFHLSGNPAGAGYTYGRAANPTWTELENALAALEGDCAGVRVFASGLAAVAAVFGVVLRPGDTVVIPGGGYFGVRQLLTECFEPMGVTVRALEDFNAFDFKGAKLVWLESPGNPRLEITDLRAAIAAAHQAGAQVAVDNTTASPLGQKPLALGADFSVCSDSKMICGHSDLILGHVACREEAALLTIDKRRNLTGAIPGPMEAWLALRSLATASLRLERSSANAQAIAEFLATRPEVGEVLYPGLPAHPEHAVARAQMLHFGPVLGFDLGSQAAAERFLARAELVTEATSFGGVTTSAERRARWGHDGVAPGFVRLSAGCEAIEDLLADLKQALDD